MIECLIYVAIWVVVILIVIAVARAILQLAGLPIPPEVYKLISLLVGLIALLLVLRCLIPALTHHPFALP